jgi:hypothetical protein
MAGRLSGCQLRPGQACHAVVAGKWQVNVCNRVQKGVDRPLAAVQLAIASLGDAVGDGSAGLGPDVAPDFTTVVPA